MRRRQVLRSAALAGTLGIAGCISQSPDDEGGGDPDDTTATDSPTPTADRAAEMKTETGVVETPTENDGSPTETLKGTDPQTESPVSSPIGDDSDETTKTRTPRSPPPMPDTVTDHTFEITDSNCGSDTDDASVAVGDPAGEILVDGTIWGSDGCATAVLDAVELDDGDLTVRVRETEKDTDEMCVQCIVELDYRATFTFEDDGPDDVTVEHVHGEETTVVESI